MNDDIEAAARMYDKLYRCKYPKCEVESHPSEGCEFSQNTLKVIGWYRNHDCPVTPRTVRKYLEEIKYEG